MESSIRKCLEALVDSDLFNGENLDLFPHALMLINKSRVVINANQLAKGIGVEVGEKYCWDTFGQCASIPKKDRDVFELTGAPPQEGTKCIFCEADQSLLTGKEQMKLIDVGQTTWKTYWVPVSKDEYLHFGVQVTD